MNQNAKPNQAHHIKNLPDALTHVACIDLPGESVQCWRSVPHIQVVLRKHRDVIFNINLFKGMHYTVHAENGDFYDTSSKQIISKGDKISFHDGELVHLWVSREFNSSLILMANGKIFGRYEPNKIDLMTYDEAPTTKPAPLIVSLSNNSPIYFGFDTLAANASAPEEDAEQTMHVIQVDPNAPGTPELIANFFKHGGEQTAIDTNGQLNRNWLWGQIAGAGAYYSDNQHWIKELWKQKFYIQKVIHAKAGKRFYIIFKGNQKLRKFFTAAKYGIANSKVLAITCGAGTAAGLRHGAWDAAKGSLKKAGLLAVIFTVALDTAEWMNDYEEFDQKTGKRKKDFFDLAFKIGIDLAKAGISAAIGAVAVGALVFFGVITGGAVLVIGAVIISVGVGLLIDWIDKKTGATDELSKMIRAGANILEKKLPSDYNNFESALQQAIAFGGMGA